MESVELSLLKSKFGSLMSFLALNCGLSLSSIEARMREKPFFDFLERNEAGAFLNKDLASIAYEVFDAKTISSTISFRNDLQYIGESYISISVSLSIPLRKLILLYPFEKMLDLYPVYHEMGPFRIIEKAKEDLESTTSFSLLLSKSPFSLLQLSKILGMDRRILKQLLVYPSAEEKLNSEQISWICKVFGVDETFLRKSHFIPYRFGLWNDEDFVALVKKEAAPFFKSPMPIYFAEERKEGIPSNSLYGVIDFDSVSLYRGEKKLRQLPRGLFDFILEKAIGQYKDLCLERRVAFC